MKGPVMTAATAEKRRPTEKTGTFTTCPEPLMSSGLSSLMLTIITTAAPHAVARCDLSKNVHMPRLRSTA